MESVLPRDEPYEGGFVLYLGVVHYLDYRTDVVPERDDYARFICKRKSFEHERDLRLIAMDWPYEDADDEAGRRILKPTVEGPAVPVDLDGLIRADLPPPRDSSWISGLVRTLAVRTGVSAPIVVSSLDEDPLY